MGSANQYATAFRDSNRLDSVQKVTTSIACHILLNRIHLDYVVSKIRRWCKAEPQFLQIHR